MQTSLPAKRIAWWPGACLCQGCRGELVRWALVSLDLSLADTSHPCSAPQISTHKHTHHPPPPAPPVPVQVEAAVATVASRLPGRRHRYSGLPYDEFADPGLQGTPAGDFTATSPAPDRRGAATFLGYQALPAAAPPAPPQEQP